MIWRRKHEDEGHENTKKQEQGHENTKTRKGKLLKEFLSCFRDFVACFAFFAFFVISWPARQ
jgi:hypothetical protein